MGMAAAKWRSASRDDLVALARKRFLAGERIDLPSLANELQVSRATAYRWAGNNEQLVAEVISLLFAETFERLVDQTRHLKGRARILALNERGLRDIVKFRPLRNFLERDPQKGLRVIASKDTPVQERTIARHQKLLDEEVGSGNLKLAVDTHTMAYALTRVAESFLYADFIAGEEPDVDKAVQILGLMFPRGD